MSKVLSIKDSTPSKGGNSTGDESLGIYEWTGEIKNEKYLNISQSLADESDENYRMNRLDQSVKCKM
jgi:hypothetical protein